MYIYIYFYTHDYKRIIKYKNLKVDKACKNYNF